MSKLLFLLLGLLAGWESQRSGRNVLGEGKIVGFICMLYEFMLIGVYVCVGGLALFLPFFKKIDGYEWIWWEFFEKEIQRERERERNRQ